MSTVWDVIKVGVAEAALGTDGASGDRIWVFLEFWATSMEVPGSTGSA